MSPHLVQINRDRIISQPNLFLNKSFLVKIDNDWKVIIVDRDSMHNPCCYCPSENTVYMSIPDKLFQILEVSERNPNRSGVEL